MEDNNNVIKQKFKLAIAVAKIKNEENIVTHKKTIFMSKRIGLSACVCLILITGVTFAKELKNFFFEKFFSGSGVETAVENGYIANAQMDFYYSNVNVINSQNSDLLDTFDVGIKIKDFLMDNNQLSIEFDFKFDEKINQYKYLGKNQNGNIDYENFGNLVLNDLVILDEENRILLFNGNEESFKRFCYEHNLNYTYNDYNENYLNTVGDSLITNIDGDSNLIQLTYNFSTNGNMPKSKQLTLYFKEITFIPKLKSINELNKITLVGNWIIDLNIPEIMYNRQDICYEVVSCENNDFNIYEAKVTDTGFKVGIMISNIEKPEYPEALSKRESELLEANKEKGGYSYSTREEFIKLYGDEKYEKMYADYMRKRDPIKTSGIGPLPWSEPTEGCYIENSNGHKFYYSSNINTNDKSDFVSENKYNYYATYDMTKYDATEEITLVIDFYGEPVKIKLKKIE